LSRQAFSFSLQYLAMLFALMLVDHYQVALRNILAGVLA
jgi:heme O synthase-like polyprenyltransferase